MVLCVKGDESLGRTPWLSRGLILSNANLRNQGRPPPHAGRTLLLVIQSLSFQVWGAACTARGIWQDSSIEQGNLFPHVSKSPFLGLLMSKTTPSHTCRKRSASSLLLLFLQNPAEGSPSLLNMGCRFSWQWSHAKLITKMSFYQLRHWKYTSHGLHLSLRKARNQCAWGSDSSQDMYLGFACARVFPRSQPAGNRWKGQWKPSCF